MRDLTPTHATTGADDQETAMFASSGGGDAFLRFIRDELAPEISSEYRTLPFNILVGHSIGGALALHALFESPEIFDGYIVIDPSTWWDDEYLIRRADSAAAASQELDGSVYLTLARPIDWGDGDPMIMIRPGRAFSKRMSSFASPDFRFELEEFENETHTSIPLLSLYHGLLYIFDGYEPSQSEIVADPSVIGPHFEAVSERLGVKLLPPEQLVNGLGYGMLYEFQEVDKAIVLFELNVETHPSSSNVYDSLGEAYMVKGDKERAIANYEKSLELNPENGNAEERLKLLRAGDGGE
jgi:tetratricopeptide (TPR) repeat protein